MQAETLHPCERIYQIGASAKIYHSEQGVCRITGKQATGQNFRKWVRDTFTDHGYLKPGTIISNEAMFCFDESSEIVQARSGKEKPQRFRTYSHIVDAAGEWHCCTKSDKQRIYTMICDGATLVCLTDSGQKHLLFKHKPGMWQLDDLFIFPNIDQLQFLHAKMMFLLSIGFTQAEIISGHYLQYRIQQAGINTWKPIEDLLKPFRGNQFFNFTAWLLFTIK